jgi:hypothetical protein
MSIAEAHALYDTVKSFFHMRSIGGLDKQNILRLELALFCLKLKFQSKQL